MRLTGTLTETQNKKGTTYPLIFQTFLSLLDLSFQWRVAIAPFIPLNYPGTPFLATHLDMGSKEATLAYIDKLAATYKKMKQPNFIISGENADIVGDTYYLEDTERIHSFGNNAVAAANLLKNLPTLRTPTVELHTSNHITQATNVSGYLTWGANGGLGARYPVDGKVKFFGKSSWYLINTVESFNGRRVVEQGNFVRWFSQNAFGGTHYQNTPVGAVTNVEEPYLHGVSSEHFFMMWELGFLFIESAWTARRTPYFMAVGDPLIKK